MKNQQTIMCDVKACKYHNDIAVGRLRRNRNYIYKKTNSINTRNNEILRILRRRVFA